MLSGAAVLMCVCGLCMSRASMGEHTAGHSLRAVHCYLVRKGEGVNGCLEPCKRSEWLPRTVQVLSIFSLLIFASHCTLIYLAGWNPCTLVFLLSPSPGHASDRVCAVCACVSCTPITRARTAGESGVPDCASFAARAGRCVKG